MAPGLIKSLHQRVASSKRNQQAGLIKPSHQRDTSSQQSQQTVQFNQKENSRKPKKKLFWLWWLFVLPVVLIVNLQHHATRNSLMQEQRENHYFTFPKAKDGAMEYKNVPYEYNNCCGPWECAYYSNEGVSGTPKVTLVMDNLATDWQRKTGYFYDGVPALNYTRKGFYLKCTTQKDFHQGYYKLMPYVRADMVQISFDNDVIYRGSTRSMAAGQIIELDARHFKTSGKHSVEIIVGVLKESRSWAMLTWARIYKEHNEVVNLMPLEKIACTTTPECYGPMTTCQDRVTKGLSSGEQPWGLCRDFVAPKTKSTDNHINGCLVYSIGIRNIYTNELLMGREGCEVHAFDCTINHPEVLGPNVTFHQWCLGSSASELKLDGLLTAANKEAQNKEFLSLPTIVRRLGHEHHELTVLKMDCEGCEWNGLDLLFQEMPAFFSRIHMLMLEMHYVTDPLATAETRMGELRTMVRVAKNLSNFRVYGFSVNSDLSIERFTDPKYFPELFRAGLFVGTCCYEFTMVRKDLVVEDKEN